MASATTVRRTRRATIDSMGRYARSAMQAARVSRRTCAETPILGDQRDDHLEGRDTTDAIDGQRNHSPDRLDGRMPVILREFDCTSQILIQSDLRRCPSITGCVSRPPAFFGMPPARSRASRPPVPTSTSVTRTGLAVRADYVSATPVLRLVRGANVQKRPPRQVVVQNCA